MLSLRTLPRLICDAGVSARGVAKTLSTASSGANVAHEAASAGLCAVNRDSGSDVATTPLKRTVLMEPTTLCRTLVQASKDGKAGKRAWKAHIKKALQIKDQLTLKQIAIVIHSCTNANVGKEYLRNLIDGLKPAVLPHLLRARRTTEIGRVELYNIYSILHGTATAEYSDTEMTSALKDAAVAQFRYLYDAGEVEPLKPFIFEDMAGIMHALMVMRVAMTDEETKLCHDLFIQLYNRNEFGTATISHRAFAICVNTLERMGCHTDKMYRVASSYLRANLDSIHDIKDIAMVYCVVARVWAAISATDGNYNGVTPGHTALRPRPTVGKDAIIVIKETGDHVEYVKTADLEVQQAGIIDANQNDFMEGWRSITDVTALVLHHLVQPSSFIGGKRADAQSVATVAAHSAPYVERGNSELLQRYAAFVAMAVEHVMQNTDVDYVSLIHLMKCAIRINRPQDAALMIAAKSVHSVGLLGTPQEFAQHIANLKALQSNNTDDALHELLDSIAISNMLQFERRLAMPPVTTKSQPQRRRALRDLIKAATNKGAAADTMFIYNDLYGFYKGADAFRHCAKTIAAIGGFNGHKAAVDIAKRIVESIENLCASQTQHADIESVAAILTGLHRFRMKNERVLHRMALETMRHLQSVQHPSILAQILIAYAKLGCPLNRNIERGLIRSPGTKRITRSKKWRNAQGPFETLFVRALKCMTSENCIQDMNAQATVNCLFALTLSGIGHRVPLLLYKLLVLLREFGADFYKSVEMKKQLKIALLVLKRSCRNNKRAIYNEVKRIYKHAFREVSNDIATTRYSEMGSNRRNPTMSGKQQPDVAATDSLQACIEREPFIKNAAYYNQFPNFVKGKYNFKDLDIDIRLLQSEILERDEVLSCVSAIGAIDTFVLLDKGELRIAQRSNAALDDGAAHALRAGSGLSNFTLAMMHDAYNPDPKLMQWKQQLEQKEFKILTIDDLMADGTTFDVDKERCLLLDDFSNLVKERGVECAYAEPIGWKYIPTQKLVDIIVRIVPTDCVISWKFRLTPGGKPLIIHKAILKILEMSQKSDKGCDHRDLKLQYPKLARCVMHTLDMPEFRLRPLRRVLSTTMAKHGIGPSLKVGGPENKVGELTVDSANDDKKQFIEVSGHGRVRYNVLIKIMRLLENTLEGNTQKELGISRAPDVKGDPFLKPFWVQIVNILLNGKYFKFIPLLVFYVEHTDSYHLCAREIEVKPMSKPNIWNPWNSAYMMRTIEAIPQMYHGVAFADSHYFKFTQEQILNLLSIYKPLKHLDIQGYCSGNRCADKEMVRKIIHIEPHKQYMVNVVH
ncbi:unc-13 homolog D-like protein, putative [Babesia ovata]|uniref:Unc-13 homolog D-like protein, putative n=1 Tax=Babesia ovata TaxID=189622 RepID=A0A2H6KI12_9APIC|nr:unc-13 homolog D-like protein, putative [Babesia ovata]GBE62625.1 unc-13 homolog D-like protein, putative [Babesia ovata]